MNKSNRDLLVLFKQELMTPKAMEHEVSLLHELLYSVEQMDHFVKAYEIIDLNKYKIIRKDSIIRQYVRRSEEAPFVFLNNRN